MRSLLRCRTGLIFITACRHNTTSSSSDVFAKLPPEAPSAAPFVPVDFSEASPSNVHGELQQIANNRKSASESIHLRREGTVGKEEADKVYRETRRSRRQQTGDNILGALIEDSLRDKDMGKHTETGDAYKRANEKMYEEEYGRKPPSKQDFAYKYIPFGPTFGLNRVVPVTLFQDDPWPQRSVTPENPVYDKNDAFGSKSHIVAKAASEMFNPRPGCNPVLEFCDSIDEFQHWELQFIAFIRDVPLWQRRSLPFLHEHYRTLAHRLLRAETRFLTCRDAALEPSKATSITFKRTEDWVERARNLLVENQKSLSSMAYDPLKMKKSLIGSLMKLDAAEFEQWKAKDKVSINKLVSEISGGL